MVKRAAAFMGVCLMLVRRVFLFLRLMFKLHVSFKTLKNYLLRGGVGVGVPLAAAASFSSSR